MIVPQNYVRSKCCKAYQDPQNKYCVRCGGSFEAETVEHRVQQIADTPCKICGAIYSNSHHAKCPNNPRNR